MAFVVQAGEGPQGQGGKGARVTVLHFHLVDVVAADDDEQGGVADVVVEQLRTADIHLPAAAGAGDGAGVLGAGPLLCTDALAVLAGPDRVLR